MTQRIAHYDFPHQLWLLQQRMLFSVDLFTLSSSDRLSIFWAIDKNASSSSPSRFCLKPQRSYGWILTRRNKTVLHTLQNESRPTGFTNKVYQAKLIPHT